MKKLFATITICLCGMILFSHDMHAQEQQQGTLRERLARRQAQQAGNTASQQLTVRAQIMNESQTRDIVDAPWVREIYRVLDLDKEKNASLYYPVKPMGDRVNLFTMIFRHVLDGSLTPYEYQLDGGEDFSDKFKKSVEDILKGFEIMYTVENGKFIVDDVDIPSPEVLRYFVKEAWYFDKNNSVVDVKTLALCPVVVRQDDFGAESTPYPMFWVRYEDVRPYAAQMPIMISSLNNASTQTINDFFIKRNFDGEIYKTTNVRNMSMAQLYPSDTLMKREQRKIETQLKQFNDNLWVYNDSIDVSGRAVAGAKAKKGSSKAVTVPGSKASSGESTTRAAVQKEAQQKNTTPVRSIRNRRRN